MASKILDHLECFPFVAWAERENGPLEEMGLCYLCAFLLDAGYIPRLRFGLTLR